MSELPAGPRGKVWTTLRIVRDPKSLFQDCVERYGDPFLMYEMAIVLGTLLRRYEFELCETKPVVPRRRNVTMGPSTGVRLRRVGKRVA